jgi:hypothetical protein
MPGSPSLPPRALRRAVLATPFLLWPRSAPAIGSAVGRVGELRGEATATGGAPPRSLAPEALVFEGDLIATADAARLTLQLGEALEVRLGGGVRLRIDRFLLRTGGTLALERGAMLLDRDARRAAATEGVAVRSPFGLIAVRGTRFFAGPSRGAFGVFVERGAVLVIGGDRAVELGPGLGADIAATGAPPVGPTRWGEPRIAEAMASVT